MKYSTLKLIIKGRQFANTPVGEKQIVTILTVLFVLLALDTIILVCNTL